MQLKSTLSFASQLEQYLAETDEFDDWSSQAEGAAAARTAERTPSSTDCGCRTRSLRRRAYQPRYGRAQAIIRRRSPT
jgi:hypothetical protein